MKSFLLITVMLCYGSVTSFEINKEKSSLKIVGTSSLHDWEMVVNEYDAVGTISETQIQNLIVTVQAESMKSGKSVMDGKAYKALETDDYPTIRFTSEELIIKEYAIEGPGVLEMAGQSGNVLLVAEIVERNGNLLRIKGQVPIKMTDFKIEPPTAMFGTLKTGDEVVIHYDILITK